MDKSVIAAGLRHSLVLRRDGTVWMWGWGYPINGRQERVRRAVLIDSVDAISAASAGCTYPILVRHDGTLWSRTGTLFDSTFKAISSSSGMKHSIVLSTNGDVWAWGENQYSQLGVGNLDKAEQPIHITQLKDIQQVSAGWFHNLALDNQGVLWGWGWNNDYQLALDMAANIALPANLSYLKSGSPVGSISAGAYHNVILFKDGTVSTWGFYTDGSIEDNEEEVLMKPPTQVDGLPRITSIVAGWSYSLALDIDGNVWGWGRNDYGQLGNGHTDFSMIPSLVKNLDNVIEIAAGGQHALALKQDGTVWGWGANIDGQLSPNISEMTASAIRIEID